MDGFRFPHHMHDTGQQANNDEVQAHLNEKYVATAYRAAAQNLAAAAFTKIAVDTKISPKAKDVGDPGKHLDLANGWYVVPNSGYYLVTGVVQIGNLAGFATAIASILGSGVERSRGTRIVNGGGNPIIAGVTVTSIDYYVRGEHIELYAFNSGALCALEVVGGSIENRLNVIRVF